MGLEPTTSWTTTRRSNQLSYSHRTRIDTLVYLFSYGKTRCSSSPAQKRRKRDGGETEEKGRGKARNEKKSNGIITKK